MLSTDYVLLYERIINIASYTWVCSACVGNYSIGAGLGKMWKIQLDETYWLTPDTIYLTDESGTLSMGLSIDILRSVPINDYITSLINRFNQLCDMLCISTNIRPRDR